MRKKRAENNGRYIGMTKRGEDGLVTLQFVLLVPLLLMLLTTILQIAFVMQAKSTVNYAAFCAIRSAIVIIPTEMRSEKTGLPEGHNVVRMNDPDSAKLDAIHRAAALALTAISPVYGANVAAATGTAPDASLAARLEKVVLLFPASVSGKDVSGQILARAPYAYDKQNTRVEISFNNRGENSGQQSIATFGDHELVTVRVTYRYYLTVPFANRLFGRPYFGSWWNGSGYYISISEQYTLPLEGERLCPPQQRSRLFRREGEGNQ